MPAWFKKAAGFTGASTVIFPLNLSKCLLAPPQE